MSAPGFETLRASADGHLAPIGFDAADWRRRFIAAGGWLFVDQRHGDLMVGLPEPTPDPLVDLVAEKDANPHARSALRQLFGVVPA